MAAQISIILTRSAGTGISPDIGESISRELRARSTNAEILFAPDGSAAEEMAKRARRASSVVVAGGGDGTVNAVASALVGSDVALGVLPLGTLNHFARDVGIPTDLQQALKVIMAGDSIRADVGEVNGHIFLNNSSLGVYPRMVREREYLRRSGWGKWPAALMASVAVLRFYPRFRVRVDAGGESIHRATSFVFVGNNLYRTEGLSFGRRCSIEEGELCLYVARQANPWTLARIATTALMKRLSESRDLDTLSARSIHIECGRRRLQVATDGEVRTLESPLQYRIRPKALRVIVPSERMRQAA